MNYKTHKPLIRLIQSADRAYFLDCVDELYTVAEKHSAGYSVIRSLNKAGRLKSWLVRKLTDMPQFFSVKIRLGNSRVINFSAMISGDFRLMIPAAFLSKNNYIYMYDVWPRFHRWIFPLLDFFSVTYVFFSSKQVFEDYKRKYPDNKCKAMWLPEALTIAEYQFKSPESRTIDVLEFGRNYAAYHELIAESLKMNDKKHVFKTPDMPVLFPGKAAFTAALADSRIVICVPSDISHPERAEYISTMTLRYLQAMASKCLIVGFLPSDMEEAFGYIPIVEIDMERAAEQLIEILDDYDAYLPLIHKNYEEVKMKHQWVNRWEVIKSKMEEVK